MLFEGYGAVGERREKDFGGKPVDTRAVFPDGSVEVMPTMAAVRRAQELGLDLILIARSALASATLTDTQRALQNLLQRAKILTPKHES